MLVNKLGVDVLLLMSCRLRFCKSFQSYNYVYYDLNNSALDFLIYFYQDRFYVCRSFVLFCPFNNFKRLFNTFRNSELVLVVKVLFLYNVIHQVDY